mmetsp:Transcript_48572/g.87274  ORF Transcript_48572/g.87274 Transcript_48572/m.87274 type:complete len:80 (+) Transcript_48572:204-443(+)
MKPAYDQFNASLPWPLTGGRFPQLRNMSWLTAWCYEGGGRHESREEALSRELSACLQGNEARGGRCAHGCPEARIATAS